MSSFLRISFWLRWKLFTGALKAAKAKGAWPQVAAVLSVVAIGFLSVFLLFAAAAFVVLAISGGDALLDSGPTPRAGALVTLRLLFFALLGLLLLMPAMRAGRGSFGSGPGGLTRLLLSPLSRRHLHACEVIGNAMDPFILALIPGLLVLGVSIAWGVGGASAGLAILASVLMIVALMAWAALLGIGLQLLFRDRRRAERVLMLAILLWVGFSVLPGFLETRTLMQKRARADAEKAAVTEAAREPATEAATEASGPESPFAPVPLPQQEMGEDERAQQRVAAHARQLALAERFPAWLQFLPSEAFARTLALVSQGRPLAALPSLFALAAFAAGCWFLSLRLWERLIGSPESSESGAVADASRLRLRRLPGLSSETSGVAFVTARGFVRTIRGKLAIAMTPLMVLMLGFMLRESRDLIQELSFLSGLIEALGLLAIGMSLLNMLPVMANSFACDRAGFTLQALTPISERRLVWGKAWGCFLVYLVCLSISLLSAQLVSDEAGPLAFVGSFVGGLGAFALAAPLGVWISILFPKEADLGKLGRAGNPHQGGQFLLMIGMGIAVGLSSVASWIGFGLLGSSWGGLLGSCAFTLLACLLAWPFMEAAAGGLEKRWEAVLLSAQGR